MTNHHFPLRVYYEDTDLGGIVYYANYLKFAERARTEMLRAAGIEQTVLRAESGIQFVVRHCAVDYYQSATLGDRLLIETRIVAARGARLTLEQDIFRLSGDTTALTPSCPKLAAILCMLACVNMAGRPVAMPEKVLLAFRAMTP